MKTISLPLMLISLGIVLITACKQKGPYNAKEQDTTVTRADQRILPDRNFICGDALATADQTFNLKAVYMTAACVNKLCRPTGAHTKFEKIVFNFYSINGNLGDFTLAGYRAFDNKGHMEQNNDITNINPVILTPGRSVALSSTPKPYVIFGNLEVNSKALTDELDRGGAHNFLIFIPFLCDEESVDGKWHLNYFVKATNDVNAENLIIDCDGTRPVGTLLNPCPPGTNQ